MCGVLTARWGDARFKLFLWPVVVCCFFVSSVYLRVHIVFECWSWFGFGWDITSLMSCAVLAFVVGISMAAWSCEVVAWHSWYRRLNVYASRAALHTFRKKGKWYRDSYIRIHRNWENRALGWTKVILRAPKISQRAPKIIQTAPKGGKGSQRKPKVSQKGAKISPNGTKREPKAAQPGLFLQEIDEKKQCENWCRKRHENTCQIYVKMKRAYDTFGEMCLWKKRLVRKRWMYRNHTFHRVE